MDNNRVLFTNKLKCCGCEMCAESCPRGVIQMRPDEEGFFYPVIAQPEKCINCNICSRLCPVQNIGDIASEFRYAVSGWTKSKEMLAKSSSGGFATALSLEFLKAGGIVYGVAYTSDYRGAEYIRADDIDEIEKLRTSKYVQSRKKKIYHTLECDLKNQRNVLFIGVPCDCAAVKIRFKSYDNLSIVSLICHGPTTQIVQQQICQDIEDKFVSEIDDFSVRYKMNGCWKPYYLYAHLKSGETYCEKWDNTSYNAAFLHLKRPSCNNCVFKEGHFAADLLIGDFHAARVGMEAYNEGGVSSILVLTDRGEKLLDDVKSTMDIFPVPLSQATHQRAVHSSYPAKLDRKLFSITLQKKGAISASRLWSVKLDKCWVRVKDRAMVRGSKAKAKIYGVIKKWIENKGEAEQH